MNCFPFQGRRISMADLEDRLFRLSPEAVGDIWMIIVTPDRVYFRTEAFRPDPAAYRAAEKQIGEEMGLPLAIDPVPPGGVFPTEFLLEPARIGKPTFYCQAESLEHTAEPDRTLDGRGAGRAAARARRRAAAGVQVRNR